MLDINATYRIATGITPAWSFKSREGQVDARVLAVQTVASANIVFQRDHGSRDLKRQLTELGPIMQLVRQNGKLHYTLGDLKNDVGRFFLKFELVTVIEVTV
jgi:hypothetical protein